MPVVFDVCVWYIHLSVQYVHPFTTWGAQRKMLGAFPYYSASFPWARASHLTLGHSQWTEVSLHFSLETDFWFSEFQNCKLTTCAALDLHALPFVTVAVDAEVKWEMQPNHYFMYLFCLGGDRKFWKVSFWEELWWNVYFIKVIVASLWKLVSVLMTRNRLRWQNEL